MKNKLNRVSRAVKNNLTVPGGILCTSALLSLFAFPTLAQEKDSESSEVEVIEVKGNRGTMTRSLNEKKNSVAILDSVAAADFGELPGLSLSDIIENIPGATGHREKGSQNEISIRGLGSYWGYATFNGRTITNAGPGRAVNFKKFPSELVDKVNIYKAQQADLVEGGTSGTVDVNSLRAVDYGKSQTTISATGVYNSYYSEVEGGDITPWGNKLVLSTVQNWQSDSLGDFGFTFGVNRTESANPEESYGGNSQTSVCALRAADGTPLSGGTDCSQSAQGISTGRVGRTPTPGEDTDLADFDESSIFYVPNDAWFRTVDEVDDRLGAVFTFQWKPNDSLDINFDYEYSRLEYNEKRYELGLETRRRNLDDHIIADDHTLLYATGESKVQLQGEDRTQTDEYDGYGVNIEFAASDNLILTLDASYSESYRYRLRHRTKFRTDERYNYALDYRNSDVPVLTFLDSNRNLPTDAGFVSAEAFDPSSMENFLNTNGDGTAYLEYRRNYEERNDKISAIAFDGEYILDNEFISSIKAGVRFSEEHLIDLPTTDVSLTLAGAERNGSTDTEDNNWDDNNTAALVSLVGNVINECQNDYQNNHLFSEENGSGGAASNYATYDHKCFIGQMLGQIPDNNGDTSFYDIGELEDGRDGSDRDVTETITAAYVMANIDAELAGLPVYGNVGVRVVKTETHSEGWGDKVYITSSTSANDETIYSSDINITGEIEALTLDSSYTEALPSINLVFAVSDEFLIKTAAYRAMSRFQLNAMSAGVSYELCENQSDDVCDADNNTELSDAITSGEANGNHMNPYLSTNYDISFEYYPSQDAAYTLAFYHKDFVGGYDTVSENRDIVVNLDGNDIIMEGVAHTTTQTSKDSSVIKGFELTAQKHFVELPEPFNGLGTKIAYNYADSTFVTPEIASPGIVADANLFGFSKNVASASVYWEGEKTTVRLLWKYRSKYFQPNNLPFPNRSHRYVQDSSYVDFSAKYKLEKNITLFAKGLNLFNTAKVQTRGNDTTIADYSRTGPKFEFGVKAKF